MAGCLARCIIDIGGLGEIGCADGCAGGWGGRRRALIRAPPIGRVKPAGGSFFATTPPARHCADACRRKQEARQNTVTPEGYHQGGGHPSNAAVYCAFVATAAIAADATACIV